MSYYRHARVKELLLKEISEIIMRELKDPRINGIISVSRVELTPDMRYAKIYISVYNGSAQKVLTALKGASSFIRGLLIQRLRMRYVPQLAFYEDRGFEAISELDRRDDL